MARILVADCTDPDFNRALAAVLRLKGFGIVDTASGGIDLLWRQLLSDPPDLLLVDRETGSQILTNLRNTAELRGVRVLVIDGDRGAGSGVPGADGYIASPAPPHAYVQAVRSALSG
jgi:DNA-binding NarL/FixJ family response regulator